MKNADFFEVKEPSIGGLVNFLRYIYAQKKIIVCLTFLSALGGWLYCQYAQNNWIVQATVVEPTKHDMKDLFVKLGAINFIFDETLDLSHKSNEIKYNTMLLDQIESEKVFNDFILEFGNRNNQINFNKLNNKQAVFSYEELKDKNKYRVLISSRQKRNDPEILTGYIRYVNDKVLKNIKQDLFSVLEFKKNELESRKLMTKDNLLTLGNMIRTIDLISLKDVNVKTYRLVSNLPKPSLSWPNKKLIMTFSIFVGLFISMVFILILMAFKESNE
ncbi:hypothetical protein [Vibrio tritonius]|uniref:hypothetical protein n=1 Tax=Vibrio tritonius TaxID=1435069 RepID=UPI000837B7F6|nr:hypothetical protein [Vibrio tritonius]